MKRTKIKKMLIGLITGLGILIIESAFYLNPSYWLFFQTETQNIDKNLTLVLGGGGNSGILVTDSAVVVIDTKMGIDAENLYKLVREKAGDKRIIIINTHYHGDHVKGNHFYKGSAVYIGNYDPAFLLKQVNPENMPTNSIRDSLILELGNETVMLYDLGQAHTFHDLVVYLKNRKILFSGDLIFHHINPVLKKESGANVDKWVTVLDLICKKFDARQIVPGHGAVDGKEMAELLRQYFTDMKIAAEDPSKATILKEKYKDWTELPTMSSPQQTINYIKENSN